MSGVYDVIIAGAGPIGLFLACELALAKVSVLVIEREPQPYSPWKSKELAMRALNTPSLEAFYRRGMIDQVAEPGGEPHQVFQSKQFAGHFAGIFLDASKIDISRYKYRLPGPALVPRLTYPERVEKAIAKRALSLGVTILRGDGVSEVSQNDDEVQVRAGDKVFRGKWLVGCDGGRSTVRRAAGFEFVGTDSTFTAFSFAADLDHPEKLKRGIHTSPGGMYVAGLASNYYMLDFESNGYDRTKEPTVEYLQEVLHRVTGIDDLNITELRMSSTFTDRCKQATSYRRGRVLLAGDAAHIHSPIGGQGLNLGLGDAVNLGWKLAAAVRGEAAGEDPQDRLALLDTYERERHPVGEWVLDWTRAQVTTLKPNPFGRAIHSFMRDLLDTPDGTNEAVNKIWGLWQRYDMSSDGENDDEKTTTQQHELVGCSAPDFEFDDGDRLGPKMLGGRGLVVSFDDEAELKALAQAYDGRVDYIGIGAKDRLGLRALLVRPDGVVAWVAEDKPDVDAAQAAMERWFGKPSQ
ncbi:monooxygenase [Hypoxylon sp. FL1284]|nr:monooxygenase [Hypoxylon sp. FL1284]